MCYRNACNGSNNHADNPAEALLDVCKVHFDEVVTALGNTLVALDSDQIKDYAKIWVIMQDQQMMHAGLCYLGDRIRPFKEKHKKNRAISRDDLPTLHWLLKRYEEEHGFNREDAILTGILQPEPFLSNLTDAYPSCDFGADADHGAFTHRLQWFVIMYAASGRYPRSAQIHEWKTPVVDLYKMLGEDRTRVRIDGLPTKGEVKIGSNSLWPALLDRAGKAGGDGLYNMPDRLHWNVRNQSVGNQALTVEVLNIQQEVVGRRVKVLHKLQKMGAVKISNNKIKEFGGKNTLKKNKKIIEDAVKGDNIVTAMRYRNPSEANSPFGADADVGDDVLRVKGDDQPGTLRAKVGAKAIDDLADELIKTGRWAWKTPRFLVRTQIRNDDSVKL